MGFSVVFSAGSAVTVRTCFKIQFQALSPSFDHFSSFWTCSEGKKMFSNSICQKKKVFAGPRCSTYQDFVNCAQILGSLVVFNSSI